MAKDRSYACKCRGSKAVGSPVATTISCKRAVALRLSNTTVRRILHLDLKFHPYKMGIVQKLHAQDWSNPVNCCQRIPANMLPYRYSLEQ